MRKLPVTLHNEILFLFSKELEKKGLETVYELKLPNGSRVDIFAWTRHSYRRRVARIFEVKGDKSDLLQDLRTKKWRKYLGYAQTVSFVIPTNWEVAIPKEAGLVKYDPAKKVFRVVRYGKLEHELIDQIEVWQRVADRIKTLEIEDYSRKLYRRQEAERRFTQKVVSWVFKDFKPESAVYQRFHRQVQQELLQSLGLDGSKCSYNDLIYGIRDLLKYFSQDNRPILESISVDLDLLFQRLKDIGVKSRKLTVPSYHVERLVNAHKET